MQINTSIYIPSLVPESFCVLGGLPFWVAPVTSAKQMLKHSKSAT